MSTADDNREAASPKTKRTVLIVTLVLVGAIGLIVRPRVSRWLYPNDPAYQGRSGGRRPITPVPAGTAERAFLAPLAEGSAIGGAEVVRISGVEEGLIHVDLRKDGAVMHFAIGLVNSEFNAPHAGRYAVYIWERAPNPAASSLAGALANSLRPHADRPPPPGLTAGTFNTPHR